MSDAAIRAFLSSRCNFSCSAQSLFYLVSVSYRRFFNLFFLIAAPMVVILANVLIFNRKEIILVTAASDCFWSCRAFSAFVFHGDEPHAFTSARLGCLYVIFPTIAFFCFDASHSTGSAVVSARIAFANISIWSAIDNSFSSC